MEFEKYVKIIIPERYENEKSKFYQSKILYDGYVDSCNNGHEELAKANKELLSGGELAACEIEYDRHTDGYICDMNKVRKFISFRNALLDYFMREDFGKKDESLFEFFCSDKWEKKRD